MQLPHGSDSESIYRRIELRAEAIIRTAATDAELHDSTDINSREQWEIGIARKLAAEWGNGNPIRPQFFVAANGGIPEAR